MTAPDQPTSREPASIATMRPLWDELDQVQRLASEALNRDDWDAWSEHAAKGAEIHERLAVLMGWRDQ